MEALIIQDKRGRLRRLRFNPPQEMVWQQIQSKLDRAEPLNVIFLKARQTGISTIVQALAFAYLWQFQSAECITMAHDFESSDSIFDMTKRFYENLDLPKADEPRKKVLRISTDRGSLTWRVMTAGAKHKARGKTLRVLHCSELAYWPNSDVFLGIQSTLPSPPIPILNVIESTANGKSGGGELFYREWKRSRVDVTQDPFAFLRIFLPWLAMPEYRTSVAVAEIEGLDEEERYLQTVHQASLEQLAWRRGYISARCQGDLGRFRQEFPATPEEAFVASGLPAFDPKALRAQRANCIPPRRYDITQAGHVVPHSKGPLALWPQRVIEGASSELVWPPIPGHRYILGADTAQGYGGNLGAPEEGQKETRSWAAAEIFDVDTLEQVGEWHHPTPGYEFARILAVISRELFAEPMLCLEMNFLGRSVQDRLRQEFQYTNLHPWKGKQDRVRAHAPVLYGWVTNVDTRGFLIDTAQEYLHEERVTLRSEKLIEQLEGFSKLTGGLYDSDLGDDCAIAAMLAWRSRQENFYPHRSRWHPDPSVNWSRLGIRLKDDPEGVLARHVQKVFGKTPWAMQGAR